MSASPSIGKCIIFVHIYEQVENHQAEQDIKNAEARSTAVNVAYVSTCK